MGIADSIPGVSGGTIAFITGIYERLIAAIGELSHFPGHLLRGRWREAVRSLNLSLFLPLLLGLGLGLIGMSHLLALLLNSELFRTLLLALFCGLVASSALFCTRRVSVWSWSRWIALVAGGLAAFLLVGALESRGSSRLYDVQLPADVEKITHLVCASNYDPFGRLLLNVPERSLERMLSLEKIASDALVYSHAEERWQAAGRVAGTCSKWIDLRTVVAGAAASGAMLLPGVSGAFVLHVAGDYEPALDALRRATRGEFDGLGLLFSILIGMVCGLLVFARSIRWLFQRHADLTTALLIGMMIGALRSLWPFWSYRWTVQPLQMRLQLEPIQPILPDLTSPLFWGVVLVVIQGAFLFLLIEALAHKISQRPLS
jgi:putative membrane protein